MSRRYQPVASATVALLDKLDASGAWEVRERVFRLCKELDTEPQREALAALLFEVAERLPVAA